MLLYPPIPWAPQRLLCEPLWSSWTRHLWRTLRPPSGDEGGGGSFARLLVFVLSCHLCLAECPYQCDCKWRGGKETVECQKGRFYEIPSKLDSGTQVLDLSENNLEVLPKDSFLDVGLIHLQRIYLRHCRISQVDKEAFRSLSNLVELDLSHNHLKYVPSWAFREAPSLRRLSLNNNPLRTLPQDAFSDMPSLEVLELSRCQLETVDITAFRRSSRLSKLKLDGNTLQYLGERVLVPLSTLQELHLHDNPWKCDCHLRALREWITAHNVPLSTSPTCNLPQRLFRRMWSELKTDDYACEPEVLLASVSTNVMEGDNVTLSCYATGNPEPSVWWLWQGRPISNLSASGQPYVLQEEGSSFSKISNLTLTLVEKDDMGTYSCVAENFASSQSANVTVNIGREATEIKGLAASHITGIAIGLGVVIVLLTVVLCIIALRCQQAPKQENHHKKMANANHKMVGNSINHKDMISRMEEQDLSLLGPNPIQKPPRLGQYQGVPTIDLDQYDTEYLPNSEPPAYKTQVVVEFAKEVDDDDCAKCLKEELGLPDLPQRPLYGGDEEEEEKTGKESSLRPILEEEGSRESEEGDDSGLELDRGGKELEVRSDADSDKERLQEKNRRNQEKRAPICLRDPSALEKELIGGSVPGITREKLRSNRLPMLQQQGGSSGGGGDSTCSSSDPPTVPSSPQRQSSHHQPTGPGSPQRQSQTSGSKVLSLMVPTVLLTCPRPKRLASFEDESEDGTEV